jgi:hypothetical protein
LVDRIAASRITKTTIEQSDCVKIIHWKDWKRWIPDNRRLRGPLAIPLNYSACHSCYVSLAVRRPAQATPLCEISSGKRLLIQC